MILSTLCYIRQGGKTLMLRRDKREKDFHKGKYNGIGGKFEPGETPEECLIREIREETGLEAKSYRYEGLLTFPLFDGVEDWYTFVYTVDAFDGDLTECDEGSLHWIPDSDLPKLNLWEGDPHFLRWIYAKEDPAAVFSAKFIYVDKQYISHEVQFIQGGKP